MATLDRGVDGAVRAVVQTSRASRCEPAQSAKESSAPDPAVRGALALKRPAARSGRGSHEPRPDRLASIVLGSGSPGDTERVHQNQPTPPVGQAVR